MAKEMWESGADVMVRSAPCYLSMHVFTSMDEPRFSSTIIPPPVLSV